GFHRCVEQRLCRLVSLEREIGDRLVDLGEREARVPRGGVLEVLQRRLELLLVHRRDAEVVQADGVGVRRDDGWRLTARSGERHRAEREGEEEEGQRTAHRSSVARTEACPPYSTGTVRIPVPISVSVWYGGQSPIYC